MVCVRCRNARRAWWSRTILFEGRTRSVEHQFQEKHSRTLFRSHFITSELTLLGRQRKNKEDKYSCFVEVSHLWISSQE